MATDHRPAVQRIVDFVNTRDVDAGVEHLPDAPRLQEWLTAQGLTGPAAIGSLDDGDVQRAHEVREALRAILLAHHGDGDGDVRAANEVLGSVALHIGFRDDGTVALEAAGGGIDAALGHLLAVIPAAAADGTWERAKICPSDTCQWAFYDHSRNRSRRWCSMEVCGNREKSKAFRARHSPGD